MHCTKKNVHISDTKEIQYDWEKNKNEFYMYVFVSIIYIVYNIYIIYIYSKHTIT